jgi:FKBP-type peptidyl-prolyl cis-trans isomerase
VRRRARANVALLALALGAPACRQIGFQNRPVPIDRPMVQMTNGVSFQELFLGDGPAAVHGDELVVDYTVDLADGKRVDSTVERGMPITMTIGEALVPGLDDALVSMRPGGCRRIFVPAALAYGKEGVEGMIPPDTDLVFEVRVIEVHARKP